MKEADILIEDNPSLELCSQIVENDILNKQADKDLQSFNDNGIWLGVHPLTLQRNFERQTIDDLKLLKAKDPLKFIDEITNIRQNMRRIKSNIKAKKFKDDDQLKCWEENLLRAEIRLQILADLLKK